MEKNENLDLCRACGGRCCKKSGCDYSTEDIKDLSLSGLCNILDEGKISITSIFIKDILPNGKKYTYPLLLLRARNTNRDVIDLLSLKTRCAQLTEAGCIYSYEDRPTGAKNLTPQANGKCYPTINPTELARLWIPYQKLLGRLVRKYTGLSVEDKIREDVEKFYDDIFNENFEYVTQEEIKDVRGFAIDLAYQYPKEYNKALSKSKSKEISVLTKNK